MNYKNNKKLSKKLYRLFSKITFSLQFNKQCKCFCDLYIALNNSPLPDEKSSNTATPSDPHIKKRSQLYKFPIFIS